MKSEFPSRASYNISHRVLKTLSQTQMSSQRHKWTESQKLCLGFILASAPPPQLVALHPLVVNKKAISPPSFTGQESAF